jgi:hypothetical protein
MRAAPPPKKAPKSPPKKDTGDVGARRHGRRKLYDDHPDDYEVDYKDETEKIDVTGVDFSNLNIKKNGKLSLPNVSCVHTTSSIQFTNSQLF